MIIKEQRTSARVFLAGVWPLAAALGLAGLLGFVAGGSPRPGAPAPGSIPGAAAADGAARASPAAGPARPAPSPPAGPFAADGGTPATAGLDTLRLTIDPEHRDVLQAARARAMAQGVLEARPEDVVPARVALAPAEGEPDSWLPARVRLKGDWLDHLDTDKWSLRVELDGKAKLRGMSEFSIQHPKTRGFLMEWMILEAARREGLIAPRATFVNVAINGRPSGIYYLEEHFTKEMLESQGRREGPIVRFREDSLWSTWRQYQYDEVHPLPDPVVLATTMFVAEVDAFGERQLARVQPMNDRLVRAIGQLRDLQRMALSNYRQLPLARLQAIEELESRTLDEVFLADKVGAWIALYSTFRAAHGVGWQQLRFYHDPVADRLEPIVFDTGANPGGGPTEPLLLLPTTVAFTGSDACREAGFRELARMAAPEWLQGLMAAIGPDFDRFGRAMLAEGLIPEGFDLRAIPRTIAMNCAQIRGLITPDDAANFCARLVRGEDQVDRIEVEAWAITAVPVEVQGFRFGNGRVVPAASVLSEPEARLRRPEGRALLPRDGRHSTFTFPVDQRLAGLRDVKEIKRAIRAREQRAQDVKVQVDVLYAPITVRDVRAERLRIRKVSSAPDDRAGRPLAPTLLEALDRHPCLDFDVMRSRLFVRKGSWDVEGDLVVPESLSLEAGPGTTLRFQAGAVLLSEGPLFLAGTADAPVVLEGRDSREAWAGVVVLSTPQRSKLEHVTVRRASSVARGGWQTTGGITFYRAPVELTDCRIEDARGEDALNVFGAEVLLERVAMAGGASDLFDGDFVTGAVRDCSFEDSVGDAIDVSGTRLSVERCRFRAIGDKALSVGEASKVLVRDCAVESAGIGLAAKDLSTVDIDGLTVERAEHFTLAVYVKKPEYGPSSVVARNLVPGEAGRQRYLVQAGCRLEVDGQVVPAEPVDVDELYRQQVLGK